MTSALPRAAHRDLHRLFAEGTCAGQTDAQLLERFIAGRDGRAFETLVIRHGPMVLAAGRAVLGNLDDAEDAFQATFLILARRAGSIRCRAGLGPWLHRVATRVAIEANARARHRRQSERRAAAARAAALPSHEARADLRGAVHEELERLPELWRRAIVLCDLEGKTHAQAAAERRWGEATVRRRLAAARNRLRSRLTRQGIAPLAVVLSATDPRGAGAAVPEAWVAAATEAATRLVAGRGAWLAATVLSRMALAPLKMTAAAGLAFTFLAWIGVAVLATGPEPVDALAQAPNAQDGGSRPPDPRVADAPTRDADKVEIQGRVLDSDGRPREGARLYLGRSPRDPEGLFPPPPPLRAASGQDGRFRFEVSRDELAGTGDGRADVVLAALAEGSGPAWIRLEPNPAGRERPLTLIKDDVPLTGRVLNLEGRPIAGVLVAVHGLIAVPGGDLPAWLRALRANRGRVNPSLWERMDDRLSLAGPGLLPRALTGSDGRFRLEGLGRDRIVALAVMGPGIKTEFRLALTTDEPDYLEVPMPNDGSETDLLHAPGFDIIAPPARLIGGIVRDAETGEPLEGIKIRDDGIGSAVTDDHGSYLLTGLAKSPQIPIRAIPQGQPYVEAEQTVDDTPGFGTIAADFSLKRGIWVEGRVTDLATGRGVKADVDYFASSNNPSRQGKYRNTDISASTDAQGRYRIVGYPGPGLLAVRAKGPGYLSAPPLKPELAGDLHFASSYQLHKDSYQVVAALELPPGPAPLKHDFRLEPGRPLQGKVIGPDGSPVSGTTVAGLHDMWAGNETLEGADFTYVHSRPGTTETLIFTQRSKRLGASLDVTGNEPGPLRIRLAPTATVVGRLVDPDGRPRPHVALITLSRRKSRGTWIGQENGRIATDGEGLFLVDGLVPGVEYELNVLSEKGPSLTSGHIFPRRWTVDPGESKDWGDVRETSPRDQ